MEEKIKIAFFGDSICFGQGISIHKGWVPRISQLLEDLAKKYNKEILVVNAGVSGDTTRLALERMPYVIQSHNFDILLIQFGMNDCNYWDTDMGVPRVSPAAFKANLHEIIDRAYNFGAKKIFLNTNHPTERNSKFKYADITYQENNAKYNTIIRTVAEERDDTVLIDVEKNIYEKVRSNQLKISDIVLKDKLHLSIRGHDEYFDMISPTLINHIKKML